MLLQISAAKLLLKMTKAATSQGERERVSQDMHKPRVKLMSLSSKARTNKSYCVSCS